MNRAYNLVPYSLWEPRLLKALGSLHLLLLLPPLWPDLYKVLFLLLPLLGLPPVFLLCWLLHADRVRCGGMDCCKNRILGGLAIYLWIYPRVRRGWRCLVLFCWSFILKIRYFHVVCWPPQRWGGYLTWGIIVVVVSIVEIIVVVTVLKEERVIACRLSKCSCTAKQCSLNGPPMEGDGSEGTVAHSRVSP